MPADLHRVALGLDVVNEDLSTSFNIIQGEGPPGANQQEQDAPIGSLYIRTDSAPDDENFWWKYRDVNDDVTDWQVGASQSFVGQSPWRDPVIVKDDTSYANLAAAEAAVNSGLIDGVAISVQDRILFTNITGENSNVFIVAAAPGSPVGSPPTILVEDEKLNEDGDALIVLDGTYANSLWTYDANTEGSPVGANAQWIPLSQANAAAELAALRSYVGGTTGDTSPDYSSEDIVSDGDDLTVGTSKLDNAIGTLQYTENFFITNFDFSNFPASTFDVTRALDDLDIELGRQADQIKVTTGTAPPVVTTVLDDTLPVSKATEVQWLLQVKDAGTKRQARIIHALTDGTTVRFSSHAVLRIGGIFGIIGLDITVGNSPLSWIVTLSPGVGVGTVTYTLKRIGYSFLA